MQFIILQQNIGNAIPVLTRETEQMHRGEIHTHQQSNHLGFSRVQNAARRWYFLTKTPLAQIKTGAIGLQIGIEPQEK